jgi:RNA polymerase sigma-70 factor (ECF subfamily)
MSKVDNLMVLWDQTRNGEQGSFALLHKTLYPGLFRYAFTTIQDADLVDDLLQELFIKFWENRVRIGEITNVRAYFYRSTRCTLLDYIRKSQLKASKLEAMPFAEFEYSNEDAIISREQDMELKEVMMGAINNLPLKQREVIHMRFYQDLNYNQIAEITGIKYQSVVNQVYRAVQILRETCLLSNIYAA